MNYGINIILKIILSIGSISSLIYINISEYNQYLILNRINDILDRIKLQGDKVKICYKLQEDLLRELNYSRSLTSISVINNKGIYIVDIKGDTPRIPASNQKLISTAYALEKLGPDFRIKTSLYKDKQNSYFLYGNGDPDFVKSDLYRFVKSIKLDADKSNQNTVNLTLYEEPIVNWWPKTWSNFDKVKNYGAPITRFALASNSANNSKYNPTLQVQKYLTRFSTELGINTKIFITDPINKDNRKNQILVDQIESAPLFSLINLANAESHNFTSEIILKAASQHWNNDFSSFILLSWLRNKRINIDGLIMSDASGLSRSNRLTTNSISKLLFKMYKHKYSKYYFSSMSLYGIRGTLDDSDYNKSLYLKFLGKTGTLDNVKSLSGIINSNQNIFFVSIIANNISKDDNILIRALSKISSNQSCS